MGSTDGSLPPLRREAYGGETQGYVHMPVSYLCFSYCFCILYSVSSLFLDNWTVDVDGRTSDVGFSGSSWDWGLRVEFGTEAWVCVFATFGSIGGVEFSNVPSSSTSNYHCQYKKE